MIKLPAKVPCHKCDGTGKIFTKTSPDVMYGEFLRLCDCEDGWRHNLGDLYRAVEDAGAIPDSKLKPKEGAPDYIAVIITCNSEHEARGDSHEEAMVNIINKVNEEAERG